MASAVHSAVGCQVRITAARRSSEAKSAMTHNFVSENLNAERGQEHRFGSRRVGDDITGQAAQLSNFQSKRATARARSSIKHCRSTASWTMICWALPGLHARSGLDGRRPDSRYLKIHDTIIRRLELEAIRTGTEN